MRLPFPCPSRILALLLVIGGLLPPGSALAETQRIFDISVSACERSATITVTDTEFYVAPIEVRIGRGAQLARYETTKGVAPALYVRTYSVGYADGTFPEGTPGTLVLYTQNGIQSVPFSVNRKCMFGSVRGTAFEDLNENGIWDAGEPKMGGAWFKFTDGGNWFVCGYAGDDSTFGQIVDHSGPMWLFPIAPVGWRTTTPRVRVNAMYANASLHNNIGFVRDARVTTVEGCDLYNPPR